MKTINSTLLLFIIIIVEGYLVLSSELLAIRQTIPYVGSGTDTISIIIAAVLMPLAFGYQYGGQFKPRKFLGFHVTVRKKLILNLLIASSILVLGLSYQFIKIFFEWLPSVGVEDRLFQISIYCTIFFILPVYLLGQTVPLVSNFFSKERLSQITGKMLFFSTVGSFMGAVFTTLVLMAFVGVHHTVSLNFVLFSVLIILLTKRKIGLFQIFSVVLSLGIAAAALHFNSDKVMDSYHIKKNNQYSTIQAGTTSSGTRKMFINGNDSSSYNDQRRKHQYVEFAERIAIIPILNSLKPRDVLVIGAGAFTFGHNDINNNYTYVDIDKDLQDVAEQYVLKAPIGDNKEFVAKPARAFLSENNDKFDVIFLDSYLGGISIPEHMVTKEFFESVKSHLKDNGILVTNFIMSPHFNNEFTRNLDNTFRSVFPHVSRHVIGEHYFLWSESDVQAANVAYIYRHEDDYDPGKIYTDNKNTVFFDKPKKLKP